MFRRRTTSKSKTHDERGIAVDSGGGGNDDDDIVGGKLHHKNITNKKRSKSTSSSMASVKNSLAVYLIVCTILLIRSYAGGITAAGNETWYPVPLIGYVRSELALLSSVIGSIPFLIVVLGWTHVGIITLAGFTLWIPTLLMPGPIPVPTQAYYCFGIIFTFLTMIVIPFWRKPQAAAIMFMAIAIIMPNLPGVVKPLFSSVPVEEIPYHVINMQPDIIEEVGAARLEAGELLDFVWKYRNDWGKDVRCIRFFSVIFFCSVILLSILSSLTHKKKNSNTLFSSSSGVCFVITSLTVKVSHGRALGYFVFG